MKYFYYLVLTLVIGCADTTMSSGGGGAGAQNGNKNQNQGQNQPTAATTTNSNSSGNASQPEVVTGAYLTCFADPDLDSTKQVGEDALGCAVNDPKTNSKIPNLTSAGITSVNYQVISAAGQSVPVRQQPALASSLYNDLLYMPSTQIQGAHISATLLGAGGRTQQLKPYVNGCQSSDWAAVKSRFPVVNIIGALMQAFIKPACAQQSTQEPGTSLSCLWAKTHNQTCN